MWCSEFSANLGITQVRQYDPEWTIHVLDDLLNFFEANRMTVSSEQTRSLIDVVKAESCAENQLVSLSARASKSAI